MRIFAELTRGCLRPPRSLSAISAFSNVPELPSPSRVSLIFRRLPQQCQLKYIFLHSPNYVRSVVHVQIMFSWTLQLLYLAIPLSIFRKDRVTTHIAPCLETSLAFYDLMNASMTCSSTASRCRDNNGLNDERSRINESRGICVDACVDRVKRVRDSFIAVRPTASVTFIVSPCKTGVMRARRFLGLHRRDDSTTRDALENAFVRPYSITVLLDRTL